MRMNEKITSTTAYSSSWIMTTFGALSLNEVALLVGIFCTLGTFVVNWYYRKKEFDRKAKHEES